MNSKKPLIFSVVLLLSVTVFAQENATPSYIMEGPGYTDFYNRVDFLKSLEGEVTEYEGSPYFAEDFIKSFIFMDNGTTYHDIPLRYNIYNDVFEFGKEEEAYTLDINFGYSKIVMGDRTFLRSAYEYSLGSKIGHMELLSEGKYNLLKKYRLDFSPPEPAGPYNGKKPASFNEMKPDYFIKTGDGDAVNFNNEKSFLKECSCEDDDLKSYIKKNKINFRKEESLISLFEYLNKR